MSKLMFEESLLINCNDLFPNTVVTFPVYVNVGGEFLLYKTIKSTISTADVRYLKDSKIEVVYIPKSYFNDFKRYVADSVDTVIHNPNETIEVRSECLSKNAGKIVETIFDDPTNPETYRKSQDLVTQFIDFMSLGEKAFHSLISLRSHDYYTYTHSVGVMIYAIALGTQLGFKDKKSLEDIGIAGLLHDVGKSKIPSEIINKAGGLNDDEFMLMQKHVDYSYEIASTYTGISEQSLMAMKQHHENLIGTGYPNSIDKNDLYMFSSLVSLCDCYSAITTDRSYSKKENSFDALQIIKKIVERGLIDMELFRNMVVMLKK